MALDELLYKRFGACEGSAIALESRLKQIGPGMVDVGKDEATDENHSQRNTCSANETDLRDDGADKLRVL
jgi:hypothetical protein